MTSLVARVVDLRVARLAVFKGVDFILGLFVVVVVCLDVMD